MEFPVFLVSMSSVDMLGRKEERTLWSQLLRSWLNHFRPVRLCDVKLLVHLSLESSSPLQWGTVQMNWAKPECSPSLQVPHIYSVSVVSHLQLPHTYQKMGQRAQKTGPVATHTCSSFQLYGAFLIESVFPPPSRLAKGTAGPPSRHLRLSSAFPGSL